MLMVFFENKILQMTSMRFFKGFSDVTKPHFRVIRLLRT